MKNKEEPSIGSLRGNHSPPVSRHHPEDPREETTGSLSRPGRTATASLEKPAFGQFPESLRAAAVDASNVEPVFFPQLLRSLTFLLRGTA